MPGHVRHLPASVSFWWRIRTSIVLDLGVGRFAFLALRIAAPNLLPPPPPVDWPNRGPPPPNSRFWGVLPHYRQRAAASSLPFQLLDGGIHVRFRGQLDETEAA